MWRARSQRLQTRIGTLQARGQRHDDQLRKMLGRIDGAMEMLGAVQAPAHLARAQHKRRSLISMAILAQGVAQGVLARSCSSPVWLRGLSAGTS